MTAPDIRTARSPLPLVALVGRPNVGKSTLFNRLVGQRRAIVDDAPGVTRDRLEALASCGGRAVRCVDTGGFTAETPTGDAATVAGLVRAQALAAVDEAAVILCVLDGTAGLNPTDAGLVRLLARTGKPVLYVVNKIDTAGHDAHLAEFYRLGVELLPISAAHNRGLDQLGDAIAAALPPLDPSGIAPGGSRLALVGRPNVGKSSLLNRLVGSERVIVTAVPGTTRDAIDTPIIVDEVPYVLVDTAGVRRRSRAVDRLERHGAVRALGALEHCDIALVVVDATEGITDQDAHLIGRALEVGRGVVILANKWDQLPAAERREFDDRVEHARPVFAHLPRLPVSAVTGEGLDRLFATVRRVEHALDRTLPTAAVNRALARVVEATPPPSPKGRPLRLYYATQTGTHPPALTIFANRPHEIPAAYARHLVARFSTTFHLVGVPLRLAFRARRPEELNRAGRGSGPRARRSASPGRAGGRTRRG